MKEVKFDKSSNKLTISTISTQEFQIPTGYDYVDYRIPNVGEYYYEPAYKSVIYNTMSYNMFYIPSRKIIVKRSLVELHTLKPGQNFLHKNERYMLTGTRYDDEIWAVSLVSFMIRNFLNIELVEKL